MRRLILPVVVIGALLLACNTKTPVGPGSVTVTQTTTSTTTSSVPTTSTPTSSTTAPSTTTTTVPSGTFRRFVALQPPPPNVPGDMTLFLELLTGASSTPSSLGRRSVIRGAGPENEYRVTGFYRTTNGLNGTVEGELGESLNPLELGGEFEGRLTVTVGGCTAIREFAGRLTSQTLDWVGGTTIQDCPGNPLSFASFSLVRTDAAPPTSTIGTTTTTVPVTTTTSTTTTPTTVTTTSILVCTYAIKPTSARYPVGGGDGVVQVVTQPGCGWIVENPDAPWINRVTPLSGNGPQNVTYHVDASTSCRTATLTIANQSFVVTQDDPCTG